MPKISGQATGRWWEEIRPQYIVVIYFFVLLLALSLQSHLVGFDVWWHLRTGQWILEEGRVPKMDPFSFTMLGEPWIAHSWLSEVFMYLLYHHIGPFSLPLLRSLLLVAAFALLLKMTWDRWPRLVGSLGLLLVGFFATARFWLARPNTASLVLFIITLYLWHLYKWHGRDYLWLLPLLMLFWANLHGGYVQGLLLLGALFIGEGLAGRFWPDPAPLGRKRWLRFGLFSLLSVPAVLVNPYGIRLLLYPLSYYLGDVSIMTQYVGEWLSPNFHEFSNILFALLLVALIVAMAWRRTGMGPSETLALLLFVGLSLNAVRVIGLSTPMLIWSIAGIVGQGVSPIASTGRRGAWPFPSKNTLWVWYGGVAIVLLLLLAATGYFYASSGRVSGFLGEEAFPSNAVDALAELPDSTRMLNSYNWGGYLIWRLYPDRLVFIDGRVDLYTSGVLEDFLAAYRTKPNWSNVLDQYQVDTVLCERQSSLATLLQESPSWNLVYDDEMASLFQRIPSSSP